MKACRGNTQISLLSQITTVQLKGVRKLCEKTVNYLVIYVSNRKQSRIVSGSRRLGVVKSVINVRFSEDAGAPPRDAFKTRKSISSRGLSPARPNLDGHVVSEPISGNILARYINQRRALCLLLCARQKAQTARESCLSREAQPLT